MGDENTDDVPAAPVVPWWQARIIQQQVAVFLGSIAALFGVAAGFDWNTWVQGLFGGVGAVMALWTIITRLRKPTPPLTKIAAERTQAAQTIAAAATAAGKEGST